MAPKAAGDSGAASPPEPASTASAASAGPAPAPGAPPAPAFGLHPRAVGLGPGGVPPPVQAYAAAPAPGGYGYYFAPSGPGGFAPGPDPAAAFAYWPAAPAHRPHHPPAEAPGASTSGPKEAGGGGGAPPVGDEHIYAWDDTSQQPVLADPRVIVELRKQGHVVLNLIDAYRTKIGSLQNAVNGPLLARRDQLVHQAARMQARMDEVAAVKATIERETRANCEEILERLRSTEALKLTLLKRYQDDLNRDIHAVQGFVNEVTQSTQTDSMLGFLRSHQALTDACHRMVNKPLRTQTMEVSADDFEHEARAYSDLANRYKALSKLLAVKDQMIWQLLHERNQLQVDMNDLVTKYNDELEAMDEQCQKYAQQLEASETEEPAVVEEPEAE